MASQESQNNNRGVIIKTLILLITLSVSLFADQELIISARKHVDESKVYIEGVLLACRNGYVLTEATAITYDLEKRHRGMGKIYIKNLEYAINQGMWEGWIYPLGRHYTTSRQESIVYLYNKYSVKKPKVVNDRERLLNN